MALTDAARRRQVRRRRLQGLRRPARRRRLGRQRALEPPGRRGQEPRPPVAPELHHRRPRRRRSSRSARWSPASAPAPRSPTGPREDIFETTTYSFETITTRIREYAFLNKGLEIVVRDERPRGRRPRSTRSRTTPSPTTSTRPAPTRSSEGEGGGIEQVFKYDRGLVDYVEHLNRRKDKANPTRHLLRGRDPGLASRTT